MTRWRRRAFITTDTELNAIGERIETLIEEGVNRNEIYAISEESKSSSKIAEYSNVNYKQASGSAGDKFASFFSNYEEEEPEDRVLERFNLDFDTRDQLIDDLVAGKTLIYLSPDNSDPTIVESDEIETEEESHNRAREDIRALDPDLAEKDDQR